MALPVARHLKADIYPLSALQAALAGADDPGSNTTWTFRSGSKVVVFTGTFSLDDDGFVERGIVTGFDVYDGDVKVMTGSGYSLVFGQIVDAAKGAADDEDGGYLAFYGTFFGNVREIGTSGSDVMAGSTIKGTFLGKGGDDLLYGGPGRDLMKGGKGDDWIEARGAADKLFGNGGSDTFAFTASDMAAVQRVEDFSHRDDTIFLDADRFTALDTGPLAKSAFTIGRKAEDATDRIIYDRKSGGLFYDADGTGAAHKVKFAELDPGLKLKAHHFDVDLLV